MGELDKVVESRSSIASSLANRGWGTALEHLPGRQNVSGLVPSSSRCNGCPEHRRAAASQCW